MRTAGEEFADFIEKREAEIATAQRKLDAAWARLVKTVGRETAEDFMFAKMGIAKPGRRQSHDEISQRIRWYLTIEHNFTKGKTSSNREIADRIRASPPHKVTFRTKPGPNVGCYIDPDTGEREFDPDVEIDHGPDKKKVAPRSLEKRVFVTRKEMIEAGKLKVAPAAPTTRWKVDSAGVKSRKVGSV